MTKLLINKDKNDYSKIVPVLQITHYSIFDTDIVADYECEQDVFKKARCFKWFPRF